MGSLDDDCELRRLPAHARHRLGQILCVADSWQSLINEIRRPDSDQLLFSAEHVDLVREESRRTGRSETDIVLDEWGSWGRSAQRPRVRHLVQLLVQLRLYKAADYVHVELLNVGRVLRPEVGPGAPVPHDETAVEELLRSRLPPSSSAKLPEPQTEQSLHITHFSYSYLQTITCDFNEGPLLAGGAALGSGAFGAVFYGRQPTGEPLAVKRLGDTTDAVNRQFRTEVQVMSSFSHANLLELMGFSCDGPHNCLVYAYMCNGSLLDRLACKDDSAPLLWRLRLEIARGTARGLVHLHTSADRPLIHRDIKSANILLDRSFVAKVGDFGLARQSGGGGSGSVHTQLTSTVLGTSAYMPPEAFRGDVSTKLDTFSFGVVLLEILTGLPPYDETREGRDLLSHVLDCDDDDCDAGQLVDPRSGHVTQSQAEGVLQLAVLCTEEKRRRPLMSAVLDKIDAICDIDT